MADHNEPVAVLGLGRFGSALALELHSRGTEVLCVDNDSKITQGFAGDLSHLVVADTTDAEAMRELGIAEFRHAVVAIGTNVEASILTTAVLAELGVADIWAKAISRQHGRILDRVGAHHVVLPEHDMGERVAHLLTGQMLDYIEVDADFAVVKTTPPRGIVGVPLGETGLRKEYDVTVVAVKPQSKGGDPSFTYATADTVLADGDIVLVVGPIGAVERFANAD